MKVSNDMPILNIQNQLVQNQMKMLEALVSTQAMIEGSNLGIIAPDIEQALKDQILTPMSYAVNSIGEISIKNAPNDAIIDILA